jgi:WD40 repeat protein
MQSHFQAMAAASSLALGQFRSGVGCVDGRGEACAERPHRFGHLGRIFKRWQPHRLWLWDKSVRVWDALTGEEKHVLNGHTDSVNSVAFSSDGSRIVSGSWDKSVRVWDALTGEEKHVLNGHTDSVTSVAFSSDGSRIVSGSWDKSVRVWDALTGEEKHVLNGHTDSVNSVAFSSDGSRIVSGSGTNPFGCGMR